MGRRILCKIMCICFMLLGGIMLCGSYAEASEVKITTKGKQKGNGNEYFQFEVRVKGMTETSAIKISSSKPVYARSEEISDDKEFSVSKKPQEFSVKKILKKEGWDEGDPVDEYLENITFTLDKKKDTGKIVFEIEVTDAGKTVAKKKYNLFIAPIENPFKKFVIGNIDITKKFDNWLELEGWYEKTVPSASSHYVPSSIFWKGGKTYSIELKKGYKLTGIWYEKHKAENDYGRKKWKNKRILPPKGFMALDIRYKDRKGKKRERNLWQMELIG